MYEQDEKYSPRNHLLWKFFDSNVELYKFYLDLIFKAGTLTFAITGAIVSYYLANETKELIHLSLVLPIVFNGGFFAIGLVSIPLSEQFTAEYNRIEKELISDAKLDTITMDPIDVSPLTNILRLFSAIYGLTAGALIVLFIFKLF
jgi:hypothetical protein